MQILLVYLTREAYKLYKRKDNRNTVNTGSKEADRKGDHPTVIIKRTS